MVLYIILYTSQIAILMIATPSILAIEVWLVRLHVGWVINTILLEPVALDWVVGRLKVGLKNRRRFILDYR